MAKIRPFQGIRPSEERAALVAALPYDVYNREEAKEVVKKNPQSFLRIDRAETNFGDEVGTYDDCVYQKAHDLLWEWVANGTFIQEEAPVFYLYELTMNGRSQTGIVACASVEDYENEVIKKHENTRAEKEADRIRHVDECDAQTGPIFLTYRAKKEIDEIVEEVKQQKPVYDFISEDGITHRVFVVSDATHIQAIESNFASMKELYIADGHHRAASAVRVGQKRRNLCENLTGKEEFCYFLSVLFPHDQLMIMDYNRGIKDLNGHTPEEIIVALKEQFVLVTTDTKPVHPQKKGQFSMLLEKKWYLFEIPESLFGTDPVESLDVSLLQNLVLEPLFGITDPKTDNRIDFIGGIRGLEELERRCDIDCKIAFAMYPTSIEELFEVADAHRLMPPKSTWFEPKLRSGLFIHKL